MVKLGGPCQGPGATDGIICGVTEIGDKSSWRRGGKFKPEHAGKACCTKKECRVHLGVIEDPRAAAPAPAAAAAPAGIDAGLLRAAGSAAAALPGAVARAAANPRATISAMTSAVGLGARAAPGAQDAPAAAPTTSAAPAAAPSPSVTHSPAAASASDRPTGLPKGWKATRRRYGSRAGQWYYYHKATGMGCFDPLSAAVVRALAACSGLRGCGTAWRSG